MTSSTSVMPSQQKPPMWRDVRYLRIASQVVGVAVVGFVLYILWFNLTNNLARLGISSDFDFLQQPGGVNIAGSDITRGASVQRFLLLGVKNTFALAVVGIPLLTIIGVLVGVARLSTNWLVARFAAVYVETLRNLPPLLIIIFVFLAFILPLPPQADPATPLGIMVVSNLRISVPWFAAVEGGAGAFWPIVGVLALVAIGLWVWRTRVNVETGVPHRRVFWSLGFLVFASLIVWLLMGRPIRLTVPSAEGRLVSGGIEGLGSYFAMLVALVLYTASHVAEITRGSILAVPKGQTEASNALALSGFQRLRYVILPQAMRIGIPPVISQYLNFVKNTSLGIAVGYAELVLIAFQAIGNGSPAPQTIILTMAGYLVFSLTISAVVNVLNSRLAIPGER